MEFNAFLERLQETFDRVSANLEAIEARLTVGEEKGVKTDEDLGKRMEGLSRSMEQGLAKLEAAREFQEQPGGMTTEQAEDLGDILHQINKQLKEMDRGDEETSRLEIPPEAIPPSPPDSL